MATKDTAQLSYYKDLILTKTTIFFAIGNIVLNVGKVEGNGGWCVARSDASNQALQTALDYACGTGADCTPIQSNALCYLPNTIQAHASYAFNSCFQRKAMAPGSCDFAGAAIIATSDPSYGSCVYPNSLSTAGGITTTTPATTNSPYTPATTTPATPTPTNGDGTAGLNPGILPADNSVSSLGSMLATIVAVIAFSLAFSFTL